MADGDQNGSVTLQRNDHPGDRADALARRLGVPQSGIGGVASDQALDHFRAAPADPSARPWIPIGPRNVGGAIRSLAQHPKNQNTFFAGSAQGGLWRSDDNGYSWRSVTELGISVPVGAIAIAPSNPQVIYVGTGEPMVFRHLGGAGLYKSEDGGSSFSRVVGAASTNADGAGDHYARIVIDPLDASRFWAANERGLWRFDSGGSHVTNELGAAFAGNSATDVALARDPGDPDKYVLLAGVDTRGIFRAVFSRSSGTTGAWTAAANSARVAGPPHARPLPVAGQFGRVRVAFSSAGGVAAQPFAYAIMEDQGTMGRHATAPSANHNRLAYPTFVFRSEDFGVTWDSDAGSVAIEPPTTDEDGSAWYCLVIEVDPVDPTHVIVGYVNLHRSIDRGRTFTQILDWDLYDAGDRAQHADFHAIVFDSRNSLTSHQLWVCNDGGISQTADYMQLGTPPVPGTTHAPTAQWRKRSFGIGAAEFTAISSHPAFPFICGGGMQDNGTFVSYGGPTWYRLDGGDGGQTAFHPTNPRRFFTSSQESVDPVEVVRATAGPPFPRLSTILPDIDPPRNVTVPQHGTSLGFPTVNKPLFVGIVESDLSTVGRLMIGRDRAGFYTVNGGTTSAAVNTPGITAGDEISAMTFAPAPATDLWVGTDNGLVFTSAASPPAPPAAGPAWTQRPLPVAQRVNAIAVHPLNDNVVAIAVSGGGGGHVFLSHDRGANWATIDGAGATALPPGPILTVQFDPADTQVIFAGTMVGVWVARNLPAQAAGSSNLGATFAAVWNTYSANLPAVQINDLRITPIKRTLRCATFGRGVFESDLPATAAGFTIPQVMLSIRRYPIDDGFVYANTFFDDPRLSAATPAPTSFNLTRAFDIRVDAPGFIRSEAFKFGEEIDGVEFDETLVSDRPLVGEINHVYVQVHNRGSAPAANVKLSLYFASAPHSPTPAGPLTPPAIDARINYPGDPAADSPWQLVAPPLTIAQVKPGEPAVARFEWTPPIEITDGVALLAVCSNDADSLATIPAGDPAAFVAAERRSAMRVTAVNRDPVYIRDGVDDDGRVGGVAWGGHSPDIIVVQSAVANPDDPNGPFKDLDNQRTTDLVKPGANIVYVRISNRTRAPVNARVKLFMLPTFDPARTAGWTQLPPGPPLEVAVNAIPAQGWKFARFNWNGVADPGPANPGGYQGFVLLAMASVNDATGKVLDPYPDLAPVTDLDSLWRFLTSGPLANNVAVRALRFHA